MRYQCLFFLSILQILFGFHCEAQLINAKPTKFKYFQEFKIKETQTGDNIINYPMHFENVGESNRLSSWWPKSCWKITKGGISVIQSRVFEANKRDSMNYAEEYNNPPVASIRGYRVPWFTLFMGDTNWLDYSFETTITTCLYKNGGEYTTAGVAFRYQNARHYYAALLLKTGSFQLVYRSENREFEVDKPAWDIIGEEPFPVVPGEKYKLRITVEGDQISCFINDNKIMEARDARIKKGKVALLADNPVEYEAVRVEGILERSQLPELPVVARHALLHTIALPYVIKPEKYDFDDLDGDGNFEILVNYTTKNKGQDYIALKQDGTIMWKLSGLGLMSIHALLDINGNGRKDIVLLTSENKIQVRDGLNGNMFFEMPAPAPNDYFGSRGVLPFIQDTLKGRQFFPSRSALTDVYHIAPVRWNKNRPSGFYVKDNYWNIWVYDNFGNLLWHRAIGTGHYPIVFDSNGDGTDEIAVSNALLDSRDGKILWDRGLEDHADKTLYTSLEPENQPKGIYIAHGESGLLKIDPLTGELLYRGDLGHVQGIGVGKFISEISGNQLIAQMRWREDNIHYLFDKNMNKIATWVLPPQILKKFSEPAAIIPINWGKNGQDLLLDSNGKFIDPLTGRTIMNPLGRFVKVLDNTQWGDQIMVVVNEERNEIQFYGKE